MQKFTTLFINNQEQSFRQIDACHDGKGSFLLKDVIAKVENKQFIKYIHDDIIPPGSTFGNHEHDGGEPFEEWYFCLGGEGVMMLDGQDYSMKSGDISVCYDGGSHGIKNTGQEDLRILVIGVSPA